jgi:hypothetical protein
MLWKIFGKDNVQSVNSISTNESLTTISLNVHESVNADDLVNLWQIVSQNVFSAVEKERREAEEGQRLAASKPKISRAVRSPSRSVTVSKSVQPKAVKPQVTKSQAAKTQAVAVKPSSANMPLQTMAQKPSQKPFQQPTQNSVQRFLPQLQRNSIINN